MFGMFPIDWAKDWERLTIGRDLFLYRHSSNVSVTAINAPLALIDNATIGL